MHNFKSSTSVQPFIRTPTCQICLEPYDEHRRVPKILQCAHTVCEECINVLEEQGRRSATNRHADRTFVNISCPVCRTVTQTPRSFIRTNYQLIDVVDGMRGEASHNVVFVACTECNGVYHEKDVNICTKCSTINDSANAENLLAREISLCRFAVCSTCILNKHMSEGHKFIRLQPLRVEMQRLENLRRIISLQEKLNRAQCTFRERLNGTMEKWITWSTNHEASLNLFKEANDSYSQKRMYDEFVRQLTKKTERIESLMKSVQRWSEDFDPVIQRTPVQSPVQPERPPRPNTPHEPLGADYLYYFEQ